jgi:hypothetical protein
MWSLRRDAESEQKKVTQIITLYIAGENRHQNVNRYDD